MTDSHVSQLQQHEVEAIKQMAASTEDPPLLMLNQNRYTAEARFPLGDEYLGYMDSLEKTLARVGGKVLWRIPVMGQPIGCDHDVIHEILAAWYPSHQAFLDLSRAEGAQEMFRRRKVCVENAVIHRCPGNQYPMQP